MTDLTELGLSSYEERAYRALLGLGAAPARDVAAASDVPEGRIYDALNGLAGRDLVERRAGEPTRYVAVDPETAVDRLLDERRADLRERRERYEAVAEAVRGDLARTTPAESRFYGVDVGSEAAVASMRAQYDRAETSLWSVVGPPYDAVPVERYENEIAAYADLVVEGLDVRLLTTPALVAAAPDRALERVLDADGVAVRTTPDIRLTYDVIDGEVAYLGVPAPFRPDEALGAVVVREGGAADALAERFERAWAEAAPVSGADP